MKVRALFCRNCKSVVFSRATHDCASCNCGKNFIDGGRDYIRVGSREGSNHVLFDLELPHYVNNDFLYSDWDNRADHHGLYQEPYPDWVRSQIEHFTLKA